MDMTQIHDFLSQVQTNARVSTVIGEPVQTNDRMLIPVAEVVYGGGGGAGGGKSAEPQTAEGSGGGVGVGVRIRPLGCWVIDANGERWVPAFDVNRAILVGGTIVSLLLLTLRTIAKRLR